MGHKNILQGRIMKINTQNLDLSCLFTLLIISLTMIAGPQPAWADIITEVDSSSSASSAPDLELAKLDITHAISEVREAIAKVRQGQYEVAVPVLQKYALRSDIKAAYVLAKLYRLGLGVKTSDEIAAGYLIANADAGHTPSMISLAEIQEQAQPAEALKNYKKAEAKGDSAANVKLGDIYERGLLGEEANPKLAFSNFEEAAKGNLPQGHYRLALCYEKGIGTSPNELLATRSFLKSATQGHVTAQLAMAIRYHEGKGLEKDSIAGFGWLTQASQNGSTEAMVLLGRLYETGDIIKPNLDLAGQWYSNAAKRKHPTGQLYLGLMYANGKGTPQDLVRAYTLLYRSAKSLPIAKEALEKLEPNLSDQQKEQVKKIISEAEAKQAG